MPAYINEIARIRALMTEIQQIRDRTCEPKNNGNPRYLALSQAVSGLKRARDDMQQEGAQG